jgi:glycine/D-amino acid oxidase-like deaminating enzyme
MVEIHAEKLHDQSASVCVIGGGIIGSWTALHLAEAGVHTTLIEQFPLPHTRGSANMNWTGLITPLAAGRHWRMRLVRHCS